MKKGKTVLIIENEVATRRVLKDKLTKEGLVVSEANNGLTGLERAQAEKPDLIILDLFMPKMSGLGVLKKLHQDSWGKQVPIIILTNLNEDQHILETIKDKNCEYLIKTNHNLASIISKIKSKLS